MFAIGADFVPTWTLRGTAASNVTDILRPPERVRPGPKGVSSGKTAVELISSPETTGSACASCALVV
jgi:hypothetical protein